MKKPLTCTYPMTACNSATSHGRGCPMRKSVKRKYSQINCPDRCCNAPKKPKPRRWTAWMVNQKDCEMDDHPLLYLTKPGRLSDDWVVIKVRIVEVVK